MIADVYERLREQLDHYSVGYPVTESGIEIRILQKLFTETEAEMFLRLSLAPETSESIAQQDDSDPDQVKSVLDGMYTKGLVFRYLKGEAEKYLDDCEATGLVTMPFNTQIPANLCNCCPDRCIGCGLCISTCPADAIQLVAKPENKRKQPRKADWISTKIWLKNGENPLCR